MKGVDGPLPGHIFFACASSTPVKMKRNTCNHVATAHWVYPREIVIKVQFFTFHMFVGSEVDGLLPGHIFLLVQVQLLSK